MEEMRGGGFAGVAKSSAAVSKPRSVWLRMPIVKNLKRNVSSPGARLENTAPCTWQSDDDT